jgi:4-cresol dehydrogenase (hydroxylating)
MARATACHRELFEAGRRYGFLAYRVGANDMDLLVGTSGFWSVVATLKGALDPNNVIAPGRYCPPGSLREQSPARASSPDRRIDSRLA